MDNNKVKETRVMKLDKPVVVRKVPMTSEGCDMLRAIRLYQQDSYRERTGSEIEIPFPTVIHLMMAEFVNNKGIDLEAERSKESGVR